MAATQAAGSGPSGLVIPVGKMRREIADQAQQLKALGGIDKQLGNLVKMEVIRRNQQQQLQQETESMNDRIEKMVKMQQLTGTPAMTLVKKKLLEKYRKVFIQGKWFEGVLQGFKDMARSAGSWLADLLGFLAVLAIFDPNGEFLASIITFLAQVVIMLTNMLARMLPAFVKLIVPLVPILIKAAWQGIKALAGALGEVIAILLKELFGITLPTGPVGQFFKTFLGGLATFGIFAAKFPILMAPLKFLFSWIGTALGPLIAKATAMIVPALSSLGASLMAVIWPVLIVIAVIAALIAIWVYAKEIVNFFDGLIDRFKNMSKGMQLLVVALAILFLPLTTFIATIYFLAKAFKRIQEVGIKQWFSEILQAVSDFFPGLWGAIMGFFTSEGPSLLDGILKPLKAIWGAITGFFTDLDKMSFADAFSNLLDNLVGAVWDLIKGMLNILVAYWKFLFVSLPLFIWEQVVRFAKWLYSIWPTIWEYIKVGFMFIFDLYKTFITMYFLILTWPLRKLWKWVKEVILPAIRGAWDELMGLGSKIFRKVKDMFNPQNILNEIRGLIGGMFDPIITQASSTFQLVWNRYVRPIMDKIGAFFAGLGGVIKALLPQALGGMSSSEIDRLGGYSGVFKQGQLIAQLKSNAPELGNLSDDQIRALLRQGGSSTNPLIAELTKLVARSGGPENVTDANMIEVLTRIADGTDKLKSQGTEIKVSTLQTRSAF